MPDFEHHTVALIGLSVYGPFTSESDVDPVGKTMNAVVTTCSSTGRRPMAERDASFSARGDGEMSGPISPREKRGSWRS